MSPDDLFKAVFKELERRAFEEEKAYQKRDFTRNERIAFRRGFDHGFRADVLRAGNDAWEAAAATLRKPDTKEAL